MDFIVIQLTSLITLVWDQDFYGGGGGGGGAAVVDRVKVTMKGVHSTFIQGG